MIVKIQDKEIELKYSMRSIIIYEAIKGETFSPKTTTDIIMYLYSTILASDKTLEVTFDNFIEWLDENPGVLGEFTDWMVNIQKVNSQLAEVSTTKKKTVKKKP